MVDEKRLKGMNEIKRVEDMRVYQHFYNLALKVADCTREFPRDFTWLRIQSLRASESVPANMAEGFYAQYSTEYLQCLFRCRREARETMTHLRYAGDLGLLPPETSISMLKDYESSLEELSRLIASIERKVRSFGKAKPNAVREEAMMYAMAP